MSEMFTLNYFRTKPQKIKVDREEQVLIVKEIEKNFHTLIMINHKEHGSSETFKLQAKSLLENIKFSIERHSFDDDIIDAILEMGDFIVYYVSGYTRRNPMAIIKDISESKSAYVDIAA